MQLNIKDDDTIALIDRLAQVTGETKTEAVRRSVQERLARREEEVERRVEEIMRLAKEINAGLSGPPIDHGELLYDPETGLPR